MTKLAPEWVRTSDPVIRSPARKKTMENVINVGGVDAILDASQRLSGSDGAFDMKTPSVAKKLKNDLRMADGKELFAIREGDNAKQLETLFYREVKG